MEDFNQKQVVDETVQAGQSECLTDTAQVSKADSLGDRGVDKATMTIEEFHHQLEENTKLINKEREDYEFKKVQLQREYDIQTDSARSALESLEQEKVEFKLSIEHKKQEWNERERNVRDFRRNAWETFTRGNAEAKSDHANKNLKLQNERHKIFEAWRSSGGGGYAAKIPSRCIRKDGADHDLATGV